MGKYYDPKVNDIIESTYNYKIAKIIEVNQQFGWFVVEYFEDNHKKRHTLSAYGTQGFRLLRKEELADFYLQCENLGITDSWS